MSIFGGLSIEERERLRDISLVSVNIDPGSTRYLLNASHSQAEAAFREEFNSLNFEPEPHNTHSPSAGTTLQIILTGVALGGGIVATEFLKEVGKKLWKTVEGIVKPPDHKDPSEGEYKGDTLKIELRMENATVNATIRLGQGNAAQLSEFLTSSPVRLFDRAVHLLGSGMPCAGCRHEQREPTEIPCRYCTRSGSKLCVVNNDLCTKDGSPMSGKYDPAARRSDFFIATGQTS